MDPSIHEKLEIQLKEHLGEAVPGHAAQNIHAALEVAEILKSQGFDFQLKDLCPGSLIETRWQAVFSKNDIEFAADHPESSVAVCTAAIGALNTPWSTT